MIINLTPHPVSIKRIDGTYLELPSCQTPARLEVAFQNVATVDGIAVKRQVFGKLHDLPEPQEDTIFFVSLLVAQAATGRTDLVSPGSPIRNPDGTISGCNGLSVL